MTDIWTAGFNGPDPNALMASGLMTGITNIFAAATVINLPQIGFSLFYFIFNATLTMMYTAHEWGRFTTQRKALRVSSPKGDQRATYWLQLPWSYSIPLIVTSGSLHWLLSRSIYLVKVDVYGFFGEPQTDKDYFACGYSPVTAFILIVLLVVMGAAMLSLGFRRLESGTPLVRLNSLAIAAACHPDPREENLELEPLMWGVLESSLDKATPYCSFSAKPVGKVQEGMTYC